jgi:hypothetical protein
VSRPQHAVGQDRGPKTASAFHGIFCAGPERPVHPITRPAFLIPEKPDALQLKVDADELIQIDSTRDHVAPEHFRAPIPDPQLPTELLIGFFLEKSDVSFLTVFVSVKSIACDSLSGDTLDLGDRDVCIVARQLLVMTDEIVPGRNKEVANLNLDTHHRPDHTPPWLQRKAELMNQVDTKSPIEAKRSFAASGAARYG